MNAADGEDRSAEQLSSSSPVPRGPLVAAAVVLAAIAITAAVLAHPKHHPSAAPRPVPTAPASMTAPPLPAAIPVADRLSVFIEPLPGCTTSDHDHAFSVAMRVTNLSGRPLRLIQVRPETEGGVGIVGTGVRIGGGGCGARGFQHGATLASSHGVVVQLAFAVHAAECPTGAAVSGLILFRVAGRVLQADSSTLATMRQLGFPSCR